MKPSIPPHEKRGPMRSEKRNVKIALVGRVKEFPAESRFRSWLRQIGDIAALPVYGGEYALYVGRRRVLGIGLGIVGLAVLLAFLPRLRSLVWPGVAWALLVVSAIVVLGVAVSILVAAVSMYSGYSRVNDEFHSTTNTLSDARSDVVRFEGRPKVAGEPASQWADVLNNLRSAEYALSKVEGSPLFGTFTGKQKGQYYQALGEVQTLIREISNETSQHRMAS
jgi:hypothetical protein